MPTDVFRTFAAPAIMLYRPYPPTDMPKVVSHAGGLPRLPDGVTWPHGSDGVALHFLACIDCAELPANDQLPDAGVLFFFARVDDEMLWDDEEDPQDASRVIYAAGPGPSPTPAPKTLPRIEGGWSNFERDFQLAGEADFIVYPRWPLISKPITSWPDIETLDNTTPGEFERLEAARVEQAAEAAGVPVPSEKVRPAWSKGHQELTFTIKTDAPFPQVWIMIDRIARHLAKSLERRRDREEKEAAAEPAQPAKSIFGRLFSKKPAQVVSLAEVTISAALSWIERAKAEGWSKPVTSATATEFQNWLTSLEAEGVYEARNAIRAGMPSAVQYAAQSPETASLFPAEYYAELKSSHQPVTYDNSGGRPETRHHQMLGHPASEQEPPPVDRDHVLLLQLFSDYGVDFMFCDVGMAEFWINKDDLAAKRFDRAWATTEGG